MAAPMTICVRRTGSAILQRIYVARATTLSPVSVTCSPNSIHNYRGLKLNSEAISKNIGKSNVDTHKRWLPTKSSTTRIRKRTFSSVSTHLPEAELKKEMEAISDQFGDTRELLDDARSSFGSVYFNEDLQEAKTSLAQTLQQYDQLLERLPEKQRQQVAGTIGLKMAELKAQEESIMEMIRED